MIDTGPLIRHFRAAALLAAAFVLSSPWVDGLVGTAVPGWAEANAQSVDITERRELKFGKVATSSAPGSVTISPTGVKSTAGGVVDLGKNHREGRFRITGPDHALVIVTLPSTATVTGPGGSGTLTNFTMDPPNPIDLGRRGRANIKVGATLNLGTHMAEGEYTGSYTVFVDLQ